MSLTNAKSVWLVLAATLVAGTAQAQAVNSQSGYALNRAQTNNMLTNMATRDANGNAVQTDGQIATGTDNSIYANTKTLGAGDTYAGAGGTGSPMSAGNTLHVVTTAAFDHSTQTLTATAQADETAAGDPTASSLNGQVNLNGF